MFFVHARDFFFDLLGIEELGGKEVHSFVFLLLFLGGNALFFIDRGVGRSITEVLFFDILNNSVLLKAGIFLPL
jgi:hypothetical protein